MNIKKEYKILDVRVDNLSRKEMLAKIECFLDEENFHQIATVNPEFILEAQNNAEFKDILNNCALNVADGFGIRCAFWRFGKKLKLRMAGADLLQEILKIAEQKNLKIFLAINKDGLSGFEEIKKALLKLYPKLSIEGGNFDILNTKYPAFAKATAWQSKIPDTTHQILLCNFGAPHQEIFLNSQKDAKIRLAMGVGGSFDFLTGKIRRAPVFMRHIGLEWLWRLFQPQSWEFKQKRLKRIWKAVVIFPIKLILCKEK